MHVPLGLYWHMRDIHFQCQAQPTDLPCSHCLVAVSVLTLSCSCVCANLQVTSKLQRVQFAGCNSVVLRLGTLTKTQTQHAELRTALQSLTPHLSHTQLTLHGFTMTAALAAELPAAAAWQQLSLTGLRWPTNRAPFTTLLPPMHTLSISEPLTDTLLVQLLQCVLSVGELCVEDLRLTKGVPQGVRVPWGVVRVVYGMRLGDWLTVAKGMGQGVTWQLEDVELMLTTGQVGTHTHTHTHTHKHN